MKSDKYIFFQNSQYLILGQGWGDALSSPLSRAQKCVFYVLFCHINALQLNHFISCRENILAESTADHMLRNWAPRLRVEKQWADRRLVGTMPLRITTFSIKGLLATHSINKAQHNNALLLCRVSLCWVSHFVYCHAESLLLNKMTQDTFRPNVCRPDGLRPEDSDPHNRECLRGLKFYFWIFNFFQLQFEISEPTLHSKVGSLPYPQKLDKAGKACHGQTL